jgi:cell division protein FtsB
MNEVTDLRQGDALLEEIAREDLGLVKEGETFVLFAEPDS